ncbi:unnamed protein product [Angiostrongylus costaricensis]|uniref:Carrier domain-containing protein n=1 Tax=Angiostrongylus costaricensis TaxID=334426 RepID=A0A0R3Q1D7_ANGCS|nr:unnamed protein product [Angiostrongylus costaricensis]
MSWQSAVGPVLSIQSRQQLSQTGDDDCTREGIASLRYVSSSESHASTQIDEYDDNMMLSSEGDETKDGRVEVTYGGDDVQQDGRTVEKILVTLRQKNGTKRNYLMNKNVSTSYDCAKHLNMMVARRAILARVSYPKEEARLESMNEPLRDKCDFELIDFQTENYAQDVNQAYWRSCSIVLAVTLLRGLKESITISSLHSKCQSFMDIIPKSYFAVDLTGLGSPLSENDLKDLSSIARSEIVSKGIPFETVTLPSEVAMDYGFDSSLVSFISIRAISKGDFTRVGGVSLPSDFKASSFSWETIVINAEDVCNSHALST